MGGYAPGRCCRGRHGNGYATIGREPQRGSRPRHVPSRARQNRALTGPVMTLASFCEKLWRTREADNRDLRNPTREIFLWNQRWRLTEVPPISAGIGVRKKGPTAASEGMPGCKAVSQADENGGSDVGACLQAMLGAGGGTTSLAIRWSGLLPNPPGERRHRSKRR